MKTLSLKVRQSAQKRTKRIIFSHRSIIIDIYETVMHRYSFTFCKYSTLLFPDGR